MSHREPGSGVLTRALMPLGNRIGIGFGLALVVACGSASESAVPSFDGPVFATLASDTGAHLVSLRLSPAAPTRAPAGAELQVMRTIDGAPEDGLTPVVAPWMPAMGHGSSRTPVVAAQGDGRYVATDVVLFMPGEWQLRVTLREGEHVVFPLAVP